MGVSLGCVSCALLHLHGMLRYARTAPHRRACVRRSERHRVDHRFTMRRMGCYLAGDGGQDHGRAPGRQLLGVVSAKIATTGVQCQHSNVVSTCANVVPTKRGASQRASMHTRSCHDCVINDGWITSPCAAPDMLTHTHTHARTHAHTLQAGPRCVLVRRSPNQEQHLSTGLLVVLFPPWCLGALVPWCRTAWGLLFAAYPNVLCQDKGIM